MKSSPTALVLDDDPVVIRLLSLRLKNRFPDMIVDCQQQPIAVGAYDIYILDNDFHGQTLAADLAEHIRHQQPESLVIALSGTLDTATLKRLINCGCAGAFDKSEPREIDAVMTMISRHIKHDSFKAIKSTPRGPRFADTARAISGLIRDWNRRLELEQQREARKLEETAQVQRSVA